MKFQPTFRQLRFLVALADRRHFGQAAEACLVSQSTLSAAIQDLEQGLGVTLFDRTRRSVAPTGIGLELAERARVLLRQSDDLVDVALAARDPLSGPLRLGVIPTIGPFLLPRALAALRAAAPELKLYLREEQPAPLVDRLEAGGSTAACSRCPYRSATVESRTSLWIVVRRLSRPATGSPALAVVHRTACEPGPAAARGRPLPARTRARGLPTSRARGETPRSKAASLHTLVQMADERARRDVRSRNGDRLGHRRRPRPARRAARRRPGLAPDRPRLAPHVGRKETFRLLAKLMRSALEGRPQRQPPRRRRRR